MNLDFDLGKVKIDNKNQISSLRHVSLNISIFLNKCIYIFARVLDITTCIGEKLLLNKDFFFQFNVNTL